MNQSAQKCQIPFTELENILGALKQLIGMAQATDVSRSKHISSQIAQMDLEADRPRQFQTGGSKTLTFKDTTWLHGAKCIF